MFLLEYSCRILSIKFSVRKLKSKILNEFFIIYTEIFSGLTRFGYLSVVMSLYIEFSSKPPMHILSFKLSFLSHLLLGSLSQWFTLSV